MSGSMEGRAVLVTGSSRGIGRATAERFGAEGALVAVHYATNDAAARDTVGAIERAGGRAFAVRSQFGTPGAIESLVEDLDRELRERTGDPGLDVLVNNAGGGGYGAVADTDEAFYDETFQLNARTPFFLAKALVPRLRPGGSVINVSSAATRLHLVQTVAYSMAKSALEDFTVCLSKEIGPQGVRVNCVVPGVIATEQSDFLGDAERKRQVIEETALRRVGQAEDLAEVVWSLAASAAFVTGQIVEVSGGYRT